MSARAAFLLLAATLVAGLLVLPAGAAPEKFDLIKRTNPDKNTTVWRIDKPNVKRRMTEYKQITFQPRDVVTIQARGCVQTGGVGRTWKHYVHPKGPNSDRLYHGLVWIPGATQGLVRVQGVINRPLRIPDKINPARLYLRLGYEDDGYGDNGYYAPDPGSDN